MVSLRNSTGPSREFCFHSSALLALLVGSAYGSSINYVIADRHVLCLVSEIFDKVAYDDLVFSIGFVALYTTKTRYD